MHYSPSSHRPTVIRFGLVITTALALLAASLVSLIGSSSATGLLSPVVRFGSAGQASGPETGLSQSWEAGARSVASGTPSVTLTPTSSPTSEPTSTPTASPSPTPTPAPLRGAGALDVRFDMSIEPQAADPGEIVTYTLGVANIGRTPVERLVVIDALPRELTYVYGSASREGSYNPTDSQVRWELLELIAGGEIALTFQARIGEAVTADLVRNVAQVTANGLRVRRTAATLSIIRRTAVGPDHSAFTSPSGRVQVEFPRQALDRAVQLRYVPRQTAETGRTLWRFSLDLLDAEGRLLKGLQFRRPVTVSVAYDPEEVASRHLDSLHLLTRLHPGGAWERLPGRVDVANHRVAASVHHFSDLTLEGEEQVLFPSSIEGFQTDLFSGAATYEHKLWAPLGAGNLSPDLTLRYNSGLVNAMTVMHDIPNEGVKGVSNGTWIGTGWTLLQGYVRLNGDWSNQLVLNGKSYRLVPEDPLTSNRWHTQPETNWLITRGNSTACDGPGTDNDVSWTVRTEDGTTYCFGGYEDNSTHEPEIEDISRGSLLSYYSCATGNEEYVKALLDEIRDTHGNTMEFAYANRVRDEANRDCNGESHNPPPISTDAQIATITYTLRTDAAVTTNYVITTTLSERPWDPLDDDKKVYERWRLDKLRIHRNLDGTLTPLREYQFQYNAPPNAPATLTSVRAYDGSGNHLQALDQDFGYVAKVIEVKRDSGCEPAYSLYSGSGNRSLTHSFLSTAANGIGGEVQFNWEVTDADAWDRVRVVTRVVRSGVDASLPVTTTYDYADTGTYHSHDCPAAAAFIGFGDVTETVEAAITNYSFYTGNSSAQSYDALNGVLQEVRYLDITGTVYLSQTNSHTKTLRLDPWREEDEVYLVWPDEIRTTTYDAASNPSLRTRTSYSRTFDSDFLLESTIEYQYGEVDVSWEDSGTDARTIHRKYNSNPNTSVWIVNQLGQESIYAGLHDSDDGVGLVARKRYRYDESAEVGTVGQKGELTAVGRWYDPINGHPYVTTTYGYDAYGNRTTITNTRGFASETAYDEVFHAFPTQQTNALGHTTTTTYYGVDDGPDLTTAGAFFGQAASVTDPNGAATTYKYDAVGRATEVRRPGDETGPATAAYIYTNYTGPSSPFQVETARRLTASQTSTSYEFYDGLGRVIQTKAGLPNNQQAVSHSTYDTQGLLAEEYVPYPVTFSSNYVAVDNEKPKTTHRYDPLGREVQVDTPSGESFTTVHSGPYTTQVDANGHYKFLVRDAFGRLSRVDETLATFEDAFDALDGSDWDSQNCGQANGQVSCSASATLSRQGGYPLAGDEGVKLEFKVDSSTTASFTLQAGGGYSWGVRTENGKLGVHRTPNDYQPEPILIDALEPDTWYVLTLKAGDGGWFYTEAWKQDDPAVRGTYLGHETGLAGLDWRFQHVVDQGTSYLDNYSELAYHTTTYTHNPLDLLSNVTDAGTNTTTIEYDPLGRKTRMVDPDMGEWAYRYEAAGNLTKQRDARDRAICFYYDDLDRLAGKTYHAGITDLDVLTCPSEPYDVSYDYDAGAYGLGRRTKMRADAGTTMWGYDARGRVVTETQSVGALGTYTTTYAYNSQDHVTALTYPDGETVTTTYNLMLQPDSLTSSLGDYVQSATYNAQGQIKTIQYGDASNPPDLITRFGYFGYDGFGMGDADDADGAIFGKQWVGRLYQTCTLPSGAAHCDDSSYQSSRVHHLTHWYDDGGNVTAVRDKLNPGSGDTQVQWFEYDALDRLVHAFTDGDGDGIPDNYGAGAYDRAYSYDAIGNITAFDGVTYGYGQASGIAPGAKPHAVTHVGGVEKFAYDTAGNMTDRDGDTLAYDFENRLASVVTDGGSVTTTFRYDGDGRRVVRETISETMVYVGAHYEARFDKPPLVEDLDDDCRVSVIDIMQVASEWGSTGGPEDVDGDGTVGLGDVEQVAGEWPETCYALAETVKYYSFGSRRIAMRKVPTGTAESQLYYLFSDHLSSTSVTYDVTTGVTQTLRYYPYGRVRGSDNIPTDRRFTGQRWDATIGLYDYRARFYDPYLNRWIQPDSIVPSPGDPQSLNRYSYVRNNPVRYRDPSGHALEDGYGILWRYTPEGQLRAINLFAPGAGHSDRDLTYFAVMQADSMAGSEEVQWINLANDSVVAKPYAYLAFRNLVKDGARWDIKDEMRFQLDSRSFRLCSRQACGWYEYSVLGNILYGFTGAEANFAEWEIRVGAGYAEARDPENADKRNWPSAGPVAYLPPGRRPYYYDNAQDYHAVGAGIEMSRRYGADVSIREFQALLVDYGEGLAKGTLNEGDVPGWPYVSGQFDNR